MMLCTMDEAPAGACVRRARTGKCARPNPWIEYLVFMGGKGYKRRQLSSMYKGAKAGKRLLIGSPHNIRFPTSERGYERLCELLRHRTRRGKLFSQRFAVTEDAKRPIRITTPRASVPIGPPRVTRRRTQVPYRNMRLLLAKNKMSGNCMFSSAFRSASTFYGEPVRDQDEAERGGKILRKHMIAFAGAREHHPLCDNGPTARELVDQKYAYEEGYGRFRRMTGDRRWAHYLKHMGRDKVWGGATELVFLSAFLRVRIVTLEEQPGGTYSRTQVECVPGGAEGTIYLLYSGKCHYDSLLPSSRGSVFRVKMPERA